LIRKLRLKFVAISMALVTVVLAIVFWSIYSSMKHNIEDLSHQVLTQVVENPAIGSGILRPGFGSGPNHSVLLPYFTVEVWPGIQSSRVYVTGGTYANLEDTEELTAILQTCLSQSAQEGTIEEYSLRYLRRDNGLFQKIAFVDMSMELAVLRNTMRSYLFIGALALLLLLGVSFLLSWWATRPVEKAWKQQRQFLSDASHELKTPLTVILSNAELLKETPLAGRPGRWADNIHSEARQMRSLVEEMLTLARADNGVHTAPFGPVPLSDLAADCALTYESVAYEAGKPLQYELDEDAHVLGDYDKLRRLVSILLDNAIKYGADAAPIALTLRKGEKQAVLTVSNTGNPIPPEHLPHLFERFYRADESRGETSGFGLGLAIAKSIANEHKASLRAESDTASTRFIFTISLKR